MTLRDDIRTIQRLVGATEDGVFGPTTAALVIARLRDTQEPAETGQGATAGTAPAPKVLSEPAAFYEALRASFAGLRQGQVDGINVLLAAASAAGWPLAWSAYALATAWHETDRTMQPIKEHGGSTYYRRKYDIEGSRPDKARELGNTVPGDGARFAGRGYVQLTGRANYAKAQEKLGAPLIGNPDLAMQPGLAARILIWGMQTGAFTGKQLADYLPNAGPADHRQFALARYIINGTDKAGPIADLALKFQAALKAGGWA